MTSVALSTVCEINPRDNGSSGLSGTSEVSFLPMAAVGEMGKGIIDEQTRVLSEVRKGYTPFRRGDVLIAKITPCFQNGKLAVATISREVGFGTTEFHVLRPHDGQLDNRYLFHFLRRPSIHEGGIRRMTGTGGQLRVPSAFFTELSIPLPPLAEQKRIAAVLDKADDLRGKRRQALATLDTLLQSVFLDMFGDPVTNPKKWPKVPLAQLCKSDEDIRCGPFGTQLLRDEFKREGVPLWGIKHVNVGFSIPTDEFVTAAKAKQLGLYSIEPGDIVMTRKGTIGNCAVYPEGWEAGIMHSDLLRLRVDRARCHPVFLSHQLHYSPDVEVQLSRIAGGAIMQGVNVSRLKSLAVLAPPKPEQLRFLKATERVAGFRAKQVVAMTGAETLFAALQSAAFAGTLFNGEMAKAAASKPAHPTPRPAAV